MNFAKYFAIAMLVGMAVEDVEAIQLSKHHKHRKGHKSLVMTHDGEEAKSKAPAKPMPDDPKVKDLKDAIKEKEDELAAAEGKTIQPKTEDEEKAETKKAIDQLAAAAEANQNKGEAAKTEQKIANLKKGLGNKDLDEGTEAEIKDKIAANEAKLSGLKKSIEKDNEIA